MLLLLWHEICNRITLLLLWHVQICNCVLTRRMLVHRKHRVLTGRDHPRNVLELLLVGNEAAVACLVVDDGLLLSMMMEMMLLLLLLLLLLLQLRLWRRVVRKHDLLNNLLSLRLVVPVGTVGTRRNHPRSNL